MEEVEQQNPETTGTEVDPSALNPSAGVPLGVPAMPRYETLAGDAIGLTKEGEVQPVIIVAEDTFGVLIGDELICRCEKKEDAERIANSINDLAESGKLLKSGKEIVCSLVTDNDKLYHQVYALKTRNFMSKMNCFMLAFLSAALLFLGIGMYHASHATPQREATAKLIEALNNFKASHDMTFMENVFN